MKKCQNCGSPIEDDEIFFEVENLHNHKEDFDCVCEECAKYFIKKQTSAINVSSPIDHGEDCDMCYFCEHVFPKSEMHLEGENDPCDWLCKDCIDYLRSRGEHLTIHYN